MGVNGPNLQDLFNQRFGANAYQSGVGAARQAGQNYYNAQVQAAAQKLFAEQQKQQAEAAKKAADAQAKLQKPITDLKNAADYWNDPTNNTDLHQKGAWRIVQDLQNDPEKQAQLKAQGYDVKAIADQAYNVATKGQIKSAEGFKSFYNDLNDQTKQMHADQKAKTGTDWKTLFDQQATQHAQKYGDTYDQQQRALANETMAQIGQNGQATQQNHIQNAVANSGVGSFGDELQRGLARGLNAATLGLPELAREKLGMEPSEMLINRNGKAGLLDKGYDFAGQALPFILSDGATSALGLGAGLAEKGAAGKLAQSALRGAVSGGLVSTGVQGVNAAINPNNFNWQNFAKQLALDTSLGGVGGVALHGAGSLLGQLNLKGQLNKVLDSAGGTPFNANEFQKAWQDAAPLSSDLKPNFGQSSAPQARKLISDVTLPGNQSEAVGNVANQTLNKKPVDVSNNNWFNFAQQAPKGRGILQDTSVSKAESGPIRSLAEDALNRSNVLDNAPTGGYNQRLLDVQKEMQDHAAKGTHISDPFVNFGQQGKPQARMNLEPVTKSSSIDPLHRSQTYWKTRYNDFANQVQANYHSNDLSEEKLQKLWTQFAKKDEPQNLHDVVDLAHGDASAGLSHKGINVEDRTNKLLSGAKTDTSNGFKLPSNKNIDELYNAVRQQHDPHSFDELIKLAQMEHGAANPGLKSMLHSDPKVKRLLDQLNATGKPSTKTPKVEVPTPVAKQTPKDLMQGLYTDRGAKPKAEVSIPKVNGKSGVSNNLLLSAKVTPLKSIKTSKLVETMNSNELHDVMAKLDKQEELLSKGGKGSESKLKAIQEDKQKVSDLLMKLDLQQHGANANPIEAVREKLKGKAPEKTPQDVAKEKAIAKAKQEAAVKKFEDAGNARKAEAAKMIEGSTDWKDKSAFSYGRETIARNFEDTMGKDAPGMIKRYIDPIKKGEADRVRFVNNERAGVKDLEIKPGSKDDKLVQMYGEGKVSKDEVMQQAKNPENVIKAADYMRKKYDELLPMINKVLKANGDKEIPFRKDYFPHYEEIDGIMHQLGFDMTNHSLPTDINGLTENFRPTKNWTSFAQRRTGDETSYGFIQGFDKYIEGASNLIYHTKNIKDMRALEDAIREVHGSSTHLSNFASQLKEYTNQLAGKRAKVDRVFEELFGRKVFNVLDTIKRKTGMNMVGANVGSAMTNFIPLTQSLATTSKPAFLKGMAETLANIGKNDGFAQKSDFLTKREGTEKLYKTWAEKATNKSMYLMKVLDDFTSNVVVRSKYNEGISKGLSEEEAMKQADTWAEKIMAGRAKGDVPTTMNSKTLGLFTQFQLEVNNQVSFLLKDIPHNATNKMQLASQIGQVMLYGYLFNNLYEQATGRRPAIDPIGIAKQAFADYNNPRLKKGTATQNLISNIAGTLPMGDLLASSAGLSSKTSRIPMGAALPNIANAVSGKSTWGAEALKPLTYLTLPTGGGAIKKTYEGLSAYNAGGQYNGKGQLQYPVEQNTANAVRGALFGKSSFPEANAYYRNNESALSDNQTKQVQNGTRSYQSILQERHNADIMKKIKEVRKNGGDPNKIAKLMSQIKH